jgi:hypothetical protein
VRFSGQGLSQYPSPWCSLPSGAGPDGHPHASRFAARCLPRVAFLAAVRR